MSRYNRGSSGRNANSKIQNNSNCHHENLKCCGLGGCGPHGCRCFCGVSCHGPLCNCRPEYRYFLCHPEPQYPLMRDDYDGAAGLGPCNFCCDGCSLPQNVNPNNLRCSRVSCGGRGGGRSRFPPGRACTIGNELTGCEARKKYFTRIRKPLSPEEAEEYCSQFCLGDILLQRFEEAKQKELQRKGANRSPGIFKGKKC